MTLITRVLFPLLAAAVLTGCAATVNRASDEAPLIAAAPIATKRVVLEIKGPSGADSGADWDAFKEEWQTSLTAALAAQGATFTFSTSTEPAVSAAAILLKMQVNDYRYVSQAKRYAVGVFSGNASLDIEVEFIEIPSNKRLGKRKYAASSSALQGVFAAMTPKQVEAVAKEIVQVINTR